MDKVKAILNLFYRRITVEDLSDAPAGKWKEKLLYAINLFFQQVYTLLSNNLSPEVNCIEQTKTFLVNGSSTPTNNTYSFATTYNYQPIFVEQWITVANSGTTVFTAAPYATCLFANGQLNVLGISGLSDGVQYQVTLRVWWPQISN